MIECNDVQLLEKYLKKYKIREKFSTPDLPFRLYCYEVGEMMNLSHPQEQYFKFLVAGRVAVDKIDSNGKLHRLFEETPFDVFGEAEICGYSFNNHYHEVVETAYCIELPLDTLRNVLWNDLKFMQFMVRRMSESIYMATYIMEDLKDDVESRLLQYINDKCPDGRFSSMELTAKRLRCSRRQLQRVVLKLVEEGKLTRTGWGEYTLSSYQDP